jgi:DNA relaxase NicK
LGSLADLQAPTQLISQISRSDLANPSTQGEYKSSKEDAREKEEEKERTTTSAAANSRSCGSRVSKERTARGKQDTSHPCHEHQLARQGN